jgi:hypothetical protein
LPETSEAIMKIMTVSTLLALTVLSACSGIPRYDDDKNGLARYTPYVGEPVTQFSSYTHFDSWSAVDNDHVLIHTNVNEVYLLTIAPGCFELPFATRLGVTSRFPNTVSSGFDSIRVGRDSCRITQIRPVNYKQMRADLAEERKAEKSLQHKQRG